MGVKNIIGDLYINDSKVVTEDTLIDKGIIIKDSEGLSYRIDIDTYIVSGIGTCTDTDIIIPSTYNGKPVTSIGNSAFEGCSSLTSITIPNSVTRVGSFAFRNCSSLTSVVIPDSVTYIGNYAFENCSSITNVPIPDSVTSIGQYAFQNCSGLTSIAIPGGVTSIGNYTFAGCNRLINVVIFHGVTSIGERAFDGCTNLADITIPDSVTSIGIYAFEYCSSLTSVVIPEGVTSIGTRAFSDCKSLFSVRIPNSVTSIGHSAFRDCSSLESVTIPDSVTTIGPSAFNGCTRLTSITIPDSVTSIGEYAFSSCTSLTIYCEALEQPSGWESDWNLSNRPVVWSAAIDIPSINTKIVNHETRITELENNSGGGSGSGSGASIIYTTEKPSTPQQAIYVITEDEVVKAEFYQSQILPSEMAYCEIVDALPEIGNPAMDLITQALYTYYLTTDGELYGYVDAILEAEGGVPVGWYPVASLFDAVGTIYGGKITSTDQATDASTMYALLTKQPKTRVYVPLLDGAFLELTSGVRTRFDEKSGTTSITEV